MKQFCAAVYRRMLTQLKQSGQQFYCAREQVQNGFIICNLAWLEVKEKLKNHRFSSEREEIEFFKTIKPRFTSLIEYYCLVYHSLLFEPEAPDAAIEFWKREEERLQKFREQHKELINCLENRRCKKLRYFFLRENFTNSTVFRLSMYEERGTVTNGDPILANLLALVKYQDYVHSRG